ncbi:MAG: EAL domain-containing protein [Gammaproteobacteria bacterium]|nr:EAL domain-containing protein [Gammaproteobacteria bacterium]
MLSTLMGNLPGMVYRCHNDKDWTVDFVSVGSYALTGYTPEDFASNRVTYGSLIHPDDSESVWAQVQKGIQAKSAFELIYRIHTASGIEKWVWERGLGIFSDVGELLFLEGFVTDISELVRAQQEVRDSHAILENVFSSTHVMIAYMDPQFNFIRVNQAYAADDGHDPDFYVGKKHFDLYPNLENEVIFRRVLETGAAFVTHARPFEYNDKTEHPERGVTFWDWSLTPVKEMGKVTGLVLLLVNVTDRLKVESERRKLSSVVEQTADAVVVTNREGIIEYVNSAFETITGYSRAEAMGQTPRLIKSGKHDKEFYGHLWKTILSGHVYRNIFINRRKDGAHYYEEKTITPIKDEQSRITHFVSTGKDITERMQAQERLQYLAYHDVLTTLPNRVLFMDRLEQALARAPRRARQLAVIFLDLDRFKVINDTLGHDFGDRLLQVLAERLGSCVREGDTVARVGGDEFAILLDDMASNDDVVFVARKIIEVFAKPLNVYQRELFVTTSVGISVFPNDGEDAKSLLKNADTAMYRAKEAGRNTYQFYSADMSVKAVERLTLETGLRRSLERNELVLHYQPLVDLKSGRIIAAEALLRWQHPQLGLVQPAEFIPLLEETGMIVAIGEWVMRQACHQAYAWQQQTKRPLRVTVNLSARQFSEPNLSAHVTQMLQETRLDPTLLEFEITESILMQHAASTIETLLRLGGLGCRFAIDDFGTGYSSLAYLKRFPIHVLKIDRSFVRDIPGDNDDAAIVSTIIAMAHNLKLQVIAEGVETEQQLAFLRASGCDAMQGYLFSRPVPAEEFARLLTAPTHAIFSDR